MAILDRLIASSIGWIPRPVVRRVATRYVAGETLEAAMAAAERLRSESCLVTFDLLGEFVKNEREAEQTVGEYLRVLDRIDAGSLNGNISIKLTAFGLRLDEDAAYERVRRVASHARSLGIFVRIDMEDSSCTDQTLHCYRRLRGDGFKNVGIVLQAYLKRTLSDIAALRDLCPNYRLCKGIYVEPPEIAYKDAEEIRSNFVAALRSMLDGGSYVGIATHDEVLTDQALAMVKVRGLKRQDYELQMLLGVSEGLRRSLVAGGHRLRVYIPYGRDWYQYCIRRLKENPRIGRYVLRAVIGRKS